MAPARPVNFKESLKLSLRQAAHTVPVLQDPNLAGDYEYWHWLGRNQATALAAMIRGDRSVELEGTNDLNQEQVEYILGQISRDISITKVDKSESWRSWMDPPTSPSSYGDQMPVYLLERRWGTSFEGAGYRLQFQRILTHGGNGMISAFKLYVHNTCSQPDNVVVKCPRTHLSVRSQDTEMMFLCQYSGAKHITSKYNLDMTAEELLHWLSSARNSRALPAGFDRDRRFPERDGVLVLERALHGNMFTFLVHAFQPRKYPFKKRQLWEMWECLVRGVAAVAYQPQAVLENYDPETMYNDTFQIRNVLANKDVSHHIHLDTEEQNILLFPGHGDHAHHPMFKLHDFGGSYSVTMKNVWENEASEEMNYRLGRVPPKQNRRAPESVHQDWDRIRYNQPVRGKSNVHKFSTAQFGRDRFPIAGRYGSWTNIFLLGQIMEGVITGCAMIHPFRAKLWGRKLPNGGRYKTYGYRLKKYLRGNRVDSELVHMVARCMAERPQDRPGPAELLDEILQWNHGWEDALAREDARAMASDTASGGNANNQAAGANKTAKERENEASRKAWAELLSRPQGP